MEATLIQLPSVKTEIQKGKHYVVIERNIDIIHMDYTIINTRTFNDVFTEAGVYIDSGVCIDIQF